MLRAAQPAGGAAGRRSGRRDDDPAARHQGRLAPVRAELLPPLPARGPAGGGRRHRHDAHRLPLRRPVRSLYLGPWRVDVEWRDAAPRLVPSTVLARTVAAALDVAGAPRPASIGLILADDAELGELNATHMGKDGPTDVLSFPLLPPSAFPVAPGQPPASGRRTAGSRSHCRPTRGRTSAT